MSKESREQVRDPLKRGDPEFLRSVTEHLPPFLPTELIQEFLAPNVVLVPTPRRAPRVAASLGLNARVKRPYEPAATNHTRRRLHPKGATLIAATSRIRDAFPNAEVRTFALARTMGLIRAIEEIAPLPGPFHPRRAWCPPQPLRKASFSCLTGYLWPDNFHGL